VLVLDAGCSSSSGSATAPGPTGPAPGAPSIRIERAFPALTFVSPVFLTSAPGRPDRLFVAEHAGRIRVFANTPTATSAPVFLDIDAQVDEDGESGLVGLAFAPDYATSGRFYVHYDRSVPSRRSIISRFRVSADPDVADAASEEVLLTVIQPPDRSNHKGGMMAFGPDGMLYIGLGDGGGAGDPDENAQDLTKLLGKILRINVGAPLYAIPSDNPFVGTPGARGEIWAYGLRNPWRFSFDAAGRLWCGDVGQGAREEVDLVTRGANLAWDVFEGILPFEPDGRPLSAFTAPVLDYDRSQGQSITGGYVYRGAAAPALAGRYVYGDFGSGRVWALAYDPASATVERNDLIGTIPQVCSFGEDAAGELYGASYGGTIHRFAPGP
jgi:glucose/arabinose dehydrogenase